MIKAYIDDSGSDEASSVYALGAVIGSARSWADIEVEWSALLQKWNLPYFKMSECHSLNGCFAGWNAAERDSCLMEFLNAVASRPVIAASVAVKRSLYLEVFRKPTEPQTKSSVIYVVLSAIIINKLGALAHALREIPPEGSRNRCAGKLHCIFDNQRGGGSLELVKPFVDAGIDYTQASSKSFVGIQAADMWTWSVRRKLTEEQETPPYARLTKSEKLQIIEIRKDMLPEHLR